MSYRVRLMHRGDVNQVTEVDREAFPTMWPATNYQRELQNQLAHYVIAYDTNRVINTPETKKRLPELISKLRRLINYNHFSSGKAFSLDRQYITGFVGLWVIAGEAHITHVAVRKTLRRLGIGELLLISAINLSSELNAHFITLEVRISNTTAQSLYQKYGFTQVGLRHGYYRDNREDAILMSLEDINSTLVRSHLNQLKQAHFRKWEIKTY